MQAYFLARLRPLLALALMIGLTCALNVAQAQKEESDNAFTGNRNKPERQEWLRDLGFGLFLHWSLDAQLGVVISHSMVGASEDYLNRYINDLPKTFDPYKYDGYRMAAMAKLAGAKYIVLTAKHHSGFCLWDTKTTDFNVMRTPFGRDLVREFVDGARKAGLAVGIYYSPEDFKFLHDKKITIQRGGLKLSSEIEKDYNDLVRRQTHELFSNYGKIDVLFIDGDHKKPCKDEAWKLQPDLLITRGAINTPEQTLPGVAMDQLWESNLTMGTQWQYKPTNDVMKSGGRLIEILIETRAKGGNLLLNVGPHPDGYIAYEEETRLREIATWHFINREAIHNVRPWIIPHEGPIWLTASKDRETVYAILTGLPNWTRGARKEFVLGSVQATPETKISVLGQNDLVSEYHVGLDVKSKFLQQANGLEISVVRAQRIYNNHKWPNPITVKLENVVPALDPPALETLAAKVQPDGILLAARLAKVGNAASVQVGFEYRPYAGFVENLYRTDWQKAQVVSADKPGNFEIKLPTPAPKGEYEFRALVVHPRLTVYGDMKRFSVK
jgi:alpha-L-fucosidase